ncbi:MAG: hypothetical protein U0U46_16275 [Saprospiraceae bacterium]
MRQVGILWNDPARWVVGKNCHIETICCPRCRSLEAAHVLHTRPDFLRLHRCQRCGGFIGPDRWQPVESADASQVSAVPAVAAHSSDAAGAPLVAAQVEAAPLIGGQGSLF